MLHFGKKFRFGKIAVNEEEETEDSLPEAHFAPSIIEEKGKSNVLPSMDFDDELTGAPQAGSRRVQPDPYEDTTDEHALDDPWATADDEDAPMPETVDNAEGSVEPQTEDAAEDQSIPTEPDAEDEDVKNEENAPELPGTDEASDVPFTEENLQFLYENKEEEEEDSVEDLSDARPADLFVKLRSLPLYDQVFGLYGGRMLLSCPDDAGGVYLFEENGDYIIAEPGDCTAYVRILSVEGVFRGKEYKTKDLPYILKEKTFPIAACVRTKEEYDLAVRDGYLPYKQSQDGKAIRMVKPMSLYRMKDTALRVEFAGGRTVGESEEYLLAFDRSLFEESEGAKHYARICKAAAEAIMKVEQPFFTLQVLKVRKNLVLAFPMDGKPAVGDRFADGRITDLAATDDGTLVMRIGNDEQAQLPLHEGKSARGQHQIVIE